jgi:hypothetical protein
VVDPRGLRATGPAGPPGHRDTGTPVTAVTRDDRQMVPLIRLLPVT